MKETNINGCLLPNLLLVLSDITPIIGSVKESIKRASAIAEDANNGSNPMTLE